MNQYISGMNRLFTAVGVTCKKSSRGHKILEQTIEKREKKKILEAIFVVKAISFCRSKCANMPCCGFG